MVTDPGDFVPDLLHPRPLRKVDAERTKLALTLAFAGGVSGALFAEALEGGQLAPSTFEPSHFARDLFLERFVAQAFRPRIGRLEPTPATSYLVRLLSHPPSEAAVVHHRRAVLAELLSTPSLRSELEQLYLDLCRLRNLLENASGARTWDATRRQLDILSTLRDIVDRSSRGFAGARSALSRLSAYGSMLREGEGYRALVDLLRHDSRLGTLNLKVGVGADGRIRGFEILSVSEDRENPFTNGPLRRWLAKFELFVRGYRFGDGEVMARLVDAVWTGLEDSVVSCVELVGDLEFYLGALAFHDRALEAGLATCLPDLVDADAPRELFGLFNPLLLLSGTVPVPCNLVSVRLASTTLVTGPNSGGKTRLLQSVALAQLLAQAGLFVPARAGAVALVPGLVVSLIQETKLDQVEGRLGMELLRIRALFERLPPGAMVLLDELCSGTNPSEGEEIFELVLSMLARLRPQAFITTHFLAFAARLGRERKIPDLALLQVELGPERRATYQFVPGVAETSLAAHAAERLGVTGEQLLALVEKNLRHDLASNTAGRVSNGAGHP